jgi:hypothetical protein
MIGNKLEQSIIKVFEENLSETFSINSISRILKKSYPNINKKSHFLIKEGILGKIEVGKSYQCYLNLANDKAKIFLAMIEINKKDFFLQKNTQFHDVILELNQLSKKFRIDTAVLHKKNLIFVFADAYKKENKEKILEQTLLTQEFNIVFLSRKEFQNQFLSNNDLRRYHHVLLNTETYVNIISEINESLMTERIVEKMTPAVKPAVNGR